MPRPGRQALNSREVHLRVVRLEASEQNYAQALSWLSADEAARAKRFYFERHRHAFVLGRASLRVLLSGYLGIAPADVCFTYGPQGKPALADHSCSLRFNVSNSSNLAAYAFATGFELGVDIEQHRPIKDFEDIAHRFFSPEETAELMALPVEERTAAFFCCWSRKEAYIKAIGGGLSIPLDSFCVTLRPDEAPRMISLGGSVEAARKWTLHSFAPAPDCAGAIAYCAEPRLLKESPLVSLDELLTTWC